MIIYYALKLHIMQFGSVPLSLSHSPIFFLFPAPFISSLFFVLRRTTCPVLHRTDHFRKTAIDCVDNEPLQQQKSSFDERYSSRFTISCEKTHQNVPFHQNLCRKFYYKCPLQLDFAATSTLPLPMVSGPLQYNLFILLHI